MKKNKKLLIGIGLIIMAIVLTTFIMRTRQQDGQEEVRIVLSMPLTGAGAKTGENAKFAYELCAKKWNEKGGVLNRHVTLDVFDNKAEAKQGAMIARQVLSTSRNVPFAVMEGVSSVFLSSQPLYEHNRVIHVCIASSEKIFENNPKYTIRSYQSAKDTCDFFLSHLKDFGIDSFTLFYADTEFANSHMEQFKKSHKEFGVKINAIYAYAESSGSYRDVIAKAGLESARAVFIAGQYQSLGRMVRQIKETGYKGLIFGDGHINSPSAVDMMSEDKNGVYAINIKQNERTMPVMDEFKSLYGREMDDIAILAYNGMDLLFQFIEKNNTMDASSISKGINGFSINGIAGKAQVVNYEIIVEHEFNPVGK